MRARLRYGARWRLVAIRGLLDRAATRAGIEFPAPSLPDEASVVRVIEQGAVNPGECARAAFGCEQLLLQHRALLDLLEAAPMRAANIKP